MVFALIHLGDILFNSQRKEIFMKIDVFRQKMRSLGSVAIFSLGLMTLAWGHEVKTTPELPLFRAYPELKKGLGYVRLGALPTPIQKLEKLGTLLDHKNLYLKKDNESGELFGGNKVRKLEFLLGDAIKNHAQGVLTIGYAGSNHTCATALYAHQVGLHCVCMHLPQVPTNYLRRNLLLSLAYGAELHLFDSWAQREIEIHQRDKEFYNQTGTHLYFIPSGGSNEIGAIGFINAAFELKEQIEQGVMPEPDYIYVAIGSVGTAAGLIAGVEAAHLKSVVVPVCIEPETFTGEHAINLCNWIRITTTVLNKLDPAFPLIEVNQHEVPIVYDFIGEGYARISPQAREAISLINTVEGIKLDGTYTGKTCAAMLRDLMLCKLRNKVVLFWDSFCDRDYTEITSMINYKQLPSAYHPYFECPLQPGDGE
jgi:D-cysteine desulfhydrase